MIKTDSVPILSGDLLEMELVGSGVRGFVGPEQQITVANTFRPDVIHVP